MTDYNSIGMNPTVNCGLVGLFCLELCYVAGNMHAPRWSVYRIVATQTHARRNVVLLKMCATSRPVFMQSELKIETLDAIIDGGIKDEEKTTYNLYVSFEEAEYAGKIFTGERE
jgi:hypothetical protein